MPQGSPVEPLHEASGHSVAVLQHYQREQDWISVQLFYQDQHRREVARAERRDEAVRGRWRKGHCHGKT